METQPIRVLVVDDSELIRRILTELLNSDPTIRVVGVARDAFEAKELVTKLQPDVITLDVEMPEVDGIRFLEVLMKARPTPVIMISTLTKANADVTLKALELGAVDYIAKPVIDEISVFNRYASTVIRKVKMAAESHVSNRIGIKHQPSVASIHANRVLAIGASTGGTEAIKAVLQQLPAKNFAVVMTQHMPAGFTTTYAARLDRITDFTVIEAQGGELIKPGHAYLAPGNLHMRVVRKGNQLYTDVFDGEKVSGHRPSVDVLFDSVAKELGKQSLATLLTGMGRDGADGLKRIHDAGGYTIAQDQASCVVFGMPREAIRLGAASAVVDLDSIGAQLLGKLS
ncbi:chemotaxis response regulator protein-glutamate methylesterase [Maribrevibacterium harenarium]|uniref:Protein-glutamate methylesterase/protein-glutamine glutaminase n=1 Tax=Maribrevibacterium harenarium TaxID=2589817 RepID=A0A501WQC2_9GAMM|nr:chemotaxis response regulator protein-glutamate methylesterase [Maribrevibacterium harenarium]TPE51548.1 chemotaxis response regulator protein-glutamate methylesterase [Maribrevibacterium harenarium]